MAKMVRRVVRTDGPGEAGEYLNHDGAKYRIAWVDRLKSPSPAAPVLVVPNVAGYCSYESETRRLLLYSYHTGVFLGHADREEQA